MRVVFIFIVILLLIALAAPATFAVQVWLDGRSTIERAQQRGELSRVRAGRLSMAEYTIAMALAGDALQDAGQSLGRSH